MKCTEIPTQKKFFGKFLYKVSIKLGGPTHKIKKVKIPIYHWFAPVTPNRENFRIVNVNDSYTKGTQKVLDRLKEVIEGRYKTRTKTRHKEKHKYSLDVYIESEDDLNRVLNEYNKKVYEIQRPLSKDHAEHLSKENTEIRKDLYWGKYRFKASLQWNALFNMNDDEMKELNQFLRSLEGDIRYCFHSYTKTIYFDSEESATLFKLSYAECIRSLTTVKTLDEID